MRVVINAKLLTIAESGSENPAAMMCFGRIKGSKCLQSAAESELQNRNNTSTVGISTSITIRNQTNETSSSSVDGPNENHVR